MPMGILVEPLVPMMTPLSRVVPIIRTPGKRCRQQPAAQQSDPMSNVQVRHEVSILEGPPTANGSQRSLEEIA